MANSAWAEEYPTGRSEYIRFEGSDHRLIITIFDPTRKRKKGLFRYDRRLKDNEEVQKLIFEAWNTNEMDTVEEKISHCRKEIIRWNKEKHRNSKEKIEVFQERLETAMTDELNNGALIEELNRGLRGAYQEEEAFWKQRSRQLWLALGEKNTSYFHAVTNGRKASNKFSVIEDEDNNVEFEESKITKVITDYYQKLFTSEEGERKETVSQALKPCISEETKQGPNTATITGGNKRGVLLHSSGQGPGTGWFLSMFLPVQLGNSENKAHLGDTTILHHRDPTKQHQCNSCQTNPEDHKSEESLRL
ncbi:unnamed protein product [Microthlaspi erraticum]|uniref:Uncharacterized protein n=1 Tax=Microthlaspi erraticum TaxID=1685480 RepID=A0A6D2L3N7_9BRAS|nr:unnamed protein product [Microthlaspi erraticum]